MDHGLARRLSAPEELYDLVYDPHETCNRVGDAALSEVLDDMRSRLEEWMQTTDDPLLDGPIPLPDGAVCNDPDDVSPADIWQYTERREGFA